MFVKHLVLWSSAMYSQPMVHIKGEGMCGTEATFNLCNLAFNRFFFNHRVLFLVKC